MIRADGFVDEGADCLHDGTIRDFRLMLVALALDEQGPFTGDLGKALDEARLADAGLAMHRYHRRLAMNQEPIEYIAEDLFLVATAEERRGQELCERRVDASDLELADRAVLAPFLVAARKVKLHSQGRLVARSRLFRQQPLEDLPNHRRQICEHAAGIHGCQCQMSMTPFDRRVGCQREDACQMPEEDHAERVKVAPAVALRCNRSQLLGRPIDDLVDHAECLGGGRGGHRSQTDTLLIDGKIDRM